jgi:glycosyltransferase involved in cell wall biosynthesis
MRRIVRRMCEEHRERHYDLELFLGQWAYGRVPGLPVVSWVQGAPGSDSRSVKRHHREIKRLCGYREYAKLRTYSIYRASRLGRPPFEHTDIPICGSRVSEATLTTVYGVAPETTRSLPYPIDLERFRQAARHVDDGLMELAWVGRIIPRKRLDLFLDAAALLIADGRDIRLTMVGGFPFAKGFQSLIDAFPFPERLSYTPRLARDDVARLLQTASVLVQPSEDEDFGSSVAEALACGTPVVVGPTNGTGQYIDDGGARFADYRAESVADAIAAVLDRISADPDGVSASARRAAMKYFSVTYVVDGLEELFNDLIKNRHVDSSR